MFCKVLDKVEGSDDEPREGAGRTRLMNAYVDVYTADRKRLIGEAVSQHDVLSKRLAQIENQSKRLLDAYKAEIIDLQEFDAERAPLKAEKDEITAKLAIADDAASEISFHPSAVASFKSVLSNLSAALCEDGELPSARLVRSVVDRVVVSPSEEKPSSPFERRAMKVQIIGGLDALLSPATKDRFTLSVVGDGDGSGGVAIISVSGDFRVSPTTLQNQQFINYPVRG